MSVKAISSPFPYPGGKSRVAPVIWRAFGNPKYYIEPFCGSAAVLLARPSSHSGIEIIGDLDYYIVNVWRSLKHFPREVAADCDSFLSQCDVDARHRYLVFSEDAKRLRDKAPHDPEFCIPKLAAYWLYCIAAWVGSDFMKQASARRGGALPYIDHHQGIFASSRRKHSIEDYFSAIQSRISRVKVINQDWKQTCSTPCILRHAAVFFDPPYGSLTNEMYRVPSGDTANEVREWCIENQKTCKIVLAGYAGEHEELSDRHGWSAIRWKAAGGFSKFSGDAESPGKQNAGRETLWLSPLCHRQKALFD